MPRRGPGLKREPYVKFRLKNKECRAFSINICPLPNWITIVTKTSPHPYMSQQNSVAACEIDLKFCISKPKSP